MLKKLELENFRSYKKAEFGLGDINLIVGNNGVGKTNFLEAIYMLCLTTSWRTDRDSEVISWGEGFARIMADEREFVVQEKPYIKRYRYKGNNQRLNQVVGSMPVVLFQPEDMQLVYGGPSLRRHFLDRLLAQIYPDYARALTELSHILKQRNRLLKMIKDQIASKNELDFWNEKLVDMMVVMSPKRGLFLRFMEEFIKERMTELIPGEYYFDLEYLASPKSVWNGLKEVGDIDVDFVENSVQISDQRGINEDIRNLISEYIKENCYKEIISGVSLYGPQREDFTMQINKHDISKYMSRGQNRIIIFALKMAELAFIEQSLKKTNEDNVRIGADLVKPILILDDIYSELDEIRQSKISELITRYQSFISAVSLPKNIQKKSWNVIELK